MNKSEYINQRLQDNKDDRQSDSKLNADARLRGSIGSKEADKIINMIDNHKSMR